MADIRNIIAAVSPDVYCDPKVRKEVKSLVEEGNFKGAIEKAKFIGSQDIFDANINRESSLKAPNPLEASGLEAPTVTHKLVYDSPSESLEPVYFWILDFLNNTGFTKVDKLADNFTSSPGSAHFSELGMKATKMQEEASKTMGMVNTVIKSVLNIIYDLKEFKIRLESYDSYKNSKGAEKSAALLSLKQIWLDSVDIKRGNTSIKAMAQQFDYVTLIDAFMAADSLDRVTKSPEEGGLDLNERVRRILQQRIVDFLKWIDESERELRKRYAIEKNYLKSQVSTLKLYSRWVKPYLDAAHKLEQQVSSSAALVTTFNTILLQLVLLARRGYDVNEEVDQGELPELFKTAPQREYTQILLVEFNFRGIPQRAGQGFTFGGKTTVSFTSLALNNEEYDVVKKEMEKSELGDVLTLIDGATKDSLDQIQGDIDSFLKEDELKEKKAQEDEERAKEQDVNPFTALFSFFKSDKKKDKKKDRKNLEMNDIKPDNTYEKIIRSQAIIAARDACKSTFETYKKAHGMPAF